MIMSLYEEFLNVFTDKLGGYTGNPVKLALKPDVVPKYCKPRPIPFAMKDKVERLVECEILLPVTSSEFATPIVPVLKKNGQLRICGDYKNTLNLYLEVDRHPIPRVDNPLNSLQKGDTYSKIDLPQAYQQVRLDEGSKKLCTISTHKGLFVYNRIPFGISSAPGIFQHYGSVVT